MNNEKFSLPLPKNEPILHYAPADSARADLKKKLQEMHANPLQIPLVIRGKEIFTRDTITVTEPHNHRHKLADCAQADPNHVEQAIEAALHAKLEWENLPLVERGKIFLRAADLLANKYRSTLNAATMLGQSKSAHQAEIDSACELIDFWRFNAHFMEKISREQPQSSAEANNSLEFRSLEGFVFAVTPFNFTAIAGNLPSAPAMMGNTCLWKPSSTSVLSNYYIMKILQEAGLPDGVINFLPGPSNRMSSTVLGHRDFTGIHFTGSTGVFNSIWRTIGENLERYRTYPRLVGETGGKDFIFAHADTDPAALATALVRGAFEYQGQKCSAASRAYVPRSLWEKTRQIIGDQLAEIKIGDPMDFSNYMNAVIDAKAFERITGYIERARRSSECKIVFGGKYSQESGYFVHPTLIETTNPKYESMIEEIFGPVLSVFVYDDAKYGETLALCESSSPYALTGAFFSRDKKVVAQAQKFLRHAAGNFYINDKPTGAVVGQQPFGGARASGTNDKAGSPFNLMRWTSPRTIKETLVPPTSYRYPFLD